MVRSLTPLRPAGAGQEPTAPLPRLPCDPGTARLLHEVLGCRVTALLGRATGPASLWLVVWGAGSVPAESVQTLAAPAAAAVAARLPAALGPGAVAVPGGLVLTPDPGRGRGTTCQLVVPLVVTGARQYAWLLGRGPEGFTASDVEHAGLLAPGLRRRFAEATTPPGLPAPLTRRELGVLALVARGLTAQAVAHRIGISERTVHAHLQHVYAKLGTRDRLSAVLRARQAGLLDPSDPLG